MNDPFAWSLPVGRLFGITVRIHWLFPFVALGFILHVALAGKPGERGVPLYPPGSWVDASVFMALLFFSVLLHEFGHCFAGRWVGGEANEVLLWPLGGLANVDVPHRAGPNFITAAGGPAVNILLAVVCLLGLLCLGDNSVQPAWNPLPGSENSFPMRYDSSGNVWLTDWSGVTKQFAWHQTNVWLVRFFWINYFSAVINVVLVGFPLDGGRMLQSALWPSFGYRQATLVAIFAGFAVVFIVGLYAIIQMSVLALCLALFIYSACQRQWVMLETGEGEGVFGYDFSQGYTSLERDQAQPAAPTPAKPKQSWWRRWLQKRAQKRLQREIEQRESDEKRMDELLQKLHKEGRNALTDEEQRFMKRVSDRYRNNRR
jgi:stage IV sporulation protein FB